MTRLSTLAVLIAWMFGVGVIVFGRSVIPAKYFTDSDRMAALSEVSDPGRASKSDVATVSFYRFIGLRGVGMTPLAGLFNITTAFALLLWLFRERAATKADIAVMFPWFMIMSVYLSMYSKEYLTVLCVGLLVLGARTRLGLVCAIAAFAAYGAFVRAYWLVILGYGVAFAVLGTLRLAKSWRLVLGIGGILASLVLFSRITGFHLTDARTLLVAFRAGDADSQTLVQNFVVNATAFHDLVNLIGGWVRFLIPISLVRFGGAQHLVFCVLQVVTVGWVVASILRSPPNRLSGNSERRREMVVLVATGAAVTLVLSAFDGDFGSYARHQVALVPWLVGVLCHKIADRTAGSNPAIDA